MKKMTLKQFKEGLKLAGHDLDVFGYDGILNTITIAMRAQQDAIKEWNPKSCLIDSYQKEIDATTEFLRSFGFYDEEQ